jgi:hypothetical protein
VGEGGGRVGQNTYRNMPKADRKHVKEGGSGYQGQRWSNEVLLVAKIEGQKSVPMIGHFRRLNAQSILNQMT